MEVYIRVSKIMTPREVVKQIHSGDTIMLGGFTYRGFPKLIVQALCKETECNNLTFFVNAPNEKLSPELEDLLSTRCEHLKCSFIRSHAAIQLMERGRMELMPQGNFSEAIRMGGSGVPAYYTPVGIGTPVAEGKEIRVFDGKPYMLQHALTGDVALFRANVVDKAGNCWIKGATKNFSPMMALACKKVFVEAETLVDVGEIDPELVTVPSIVVTGIVEVTATHDM